MSAKHDIIKDLKERIGAIEWMRESVTSYALGIPAIDAALKYGGITAGSCHEIISSHEGPALGFTLTLLSSMVKKGPVMWCALAHDLYTPGFATYGIKDTDIVFVDAKDHKQALWAMEEGLSCNKISAVLLQTTQLSLAQGRRLKLLAYKHNTTGLFMIKPNARIKLPTIATTRWSIKHEPSTGRPSRNGINSVGAPRLSISLLRNLYGLAPLSWTVVFDEQTLRFHTLPSLLPSTHEHHPPNTAHSREGVA